MFLRPDPEGSTRVVLSVQQDPQGWDDLAPDQQKAVLMEHFADAGSETPRVLECLKTTKDFYFHSIATVKLDQIYAGRVALMGYAAWAVMRRGTTLTLIEAYVLAEELAQKGDVDTALSD